MKSLIEVLKRALKRLAASESGEFLSTRRKAHLLYAEMYTRVASEAEAQRGRAESLQTDKPVLRKIDAPAAVVGRTGIAV